MKKLISSVLVAGILATMSMSAFAVDQGTTKVENGTDVYAGVYMDKRDQMVYVEVPTMLAFVAKSNGKTDDATQVTTVSPTATVLNGAISYSGSSELQFLNYSTQLTTDNGTTREGLTVTLIGTLQNAATKGSWEFVATAPGATTAEKYKYSLTCAGQDFSATSVSGDPMMAAGIELPAPNITAEADWNATTKLANQPTATASDFVVTAGGAHKDYTANEDSVKVATISWTVAPVA